MYQKTDNGDKNLTTPSGEWVKECFVDNGVTLTPNTEIGFVNDTSTSYRKWMWAGMFLLLLMVLIVAWMVYNKKSDK